MSSTTPQNTPQSTPLGSSANLVITLGVFLKLLGFFVVLYSYSVSVPMKIDQAEQSLKQRFNVTLNLPGKGGHDLNSITPVQGAGRAYDAIEKDLKTQIDLFSTEIDATSNELILVLPADQILGLSGQVAKSPDFDRILLDTLKRNEPKGFHYRLAVIGIGGASDDMMRGLGNFAQDIVAGNYPQRLLSIGYETGKSGTAQVRLRVLAVPR